VITGIQAELLPDRNGQYRREQIRIINQSTSESLYTPPPANEIARLIENWENYVNLPPEGVDPLLRAIIAHYQFEAIHPFRDGNGRTGRILMILQLIQDRLLNLPVLYISGYINAHRSDYYRHLLGVTRDGNWHDFIRYMLEGFHAQARVTHDDLTKIARLLDEIKQEVRARDKKLYSADLVQALFAYPVITPTKLAAELNKHYTTTSKYLARLAKMGILRKKVIGKYHLFANHRLLSILNK
jgi:Fic family protein